MKNSRLRMCWMVVLVITGLGSAFAQSSEVKQLLLNTEKLAQLKNILSDMKQGYEILSKGYGSVKNIAEGNFSLHEEFLDALLVVSPSVKKYRRVAEILRDQKLLVSEYRSALGEFRSGSVFNAGELEYLEKVYSGLLKASLQNLEDLTMVITSSSLRMNDAERLEAIDRIFADTADKLVFLRSFNQRAVVLFQQKKKEKRELESFRAYYGLGGN
ncbi:MAG: TerB family tellurite resistance protein [Pedobacter sp.]|nr:MAG: TerB family tellurite resistance protein [Pedobacter sp.]